MRFGFVVPFGGARFVAEVAKEAEAAGWDGVFTWEAPWAIDAWMSLTAAAMVTSRIRLGTMLTPISRMRPWDLASKTVTLDQLSGGRTILAVGLGAVDTGFAEFGEETDIRVRAELMDEGLDIIQGLWRGQPFTYDGKHYHVRPVSFSPPPPPVQQPRIPTWMVGVWPKMQSMRRVLSYDGLVHQGGPETLAPARAWIEAHRTAADSFEYVCEGTTPAPEGPETRTVIEPWVEAGATWYNEAAWQLANDAEGVARVLERVRMGPPRA